MERRHKKRKVTAASGEEPRCFVEDVPDDLLRLILLRLDSPLWLLRAACACKRWRRVVTGDGADADGSRAFLRLASSLHPPAVLGHYQNNIDDGGRRFVPLWPTPPSPTANGSRFFSLNFIPWDLVSGATPMENWEVADCHGGLVLLRERHGFLSDLVVCDPLTRRYRRIHHPPGQGIQYLLRRRRWSLGPIVGRYYVANIFLIDGDDGNTSISNFRVLYRSDDGDEYQGSQLYVFSMTSGGGSGWRFLRWSQLDDRYRDGFGRVAGRVAGSLYLGLHTGAVTVLDKDKLEFCKVDLPPIDRDVVRSTFAVVHGADPTSPSAKVAFIVRVHGETLELFRHVRGSGEWVLEHSIRELSRATRRLPGYPDPKCFWWWQTVEVIAGGTGFAILSAWVSEGGSSTTWLFSFDVDTMELQALTNEAAYCGKAMTSTYTMPWPRFLCAGQPLLKPKSRSLIKPNPPMFQFPRAS